MSRLGTRMGIAALCLLLAATATAEPRRDSIADLDALAAQHSWQELGDHLMDIPPTERDAHWQALVEQAAIGELAPLASSSSFADQLATIDRYYPAFPSLARSPNFMALRAKIGLAAFRRCFEVAEERGADPSPCRSHLADFASTEPVDLAVVKGAAEIVAVKLNQSAAANFYAIALAAGESLCAEPGLATVTVAALGEPVETSEAKAAKSLLDRCFDPLKEAVLENFGKVQPGSPYMRNTCPALVAHNLLSGLRAQRCKDLAGN